MQQSYKPYKRVYRKKQPVKNQPKQDPIIVVDKPKSKKYAGASKYYGGKIGKYIGGYFGAPNIGKMLGSSAGSLFSKITGLGEYHVKSNSLLNLGIHGMTDPPVVSNTKAGTRIRHREYIQDISSTVAFTNTSFSINPGVNTTFPWLSQIARNYQQYIIHGMIFEFISTSADALNSTNTALGTVILGTDYNASDPAFINK